MTYAFYTFAMVVLAGAFLFIWNIWRESQTRQWNWINEQSRTMYSDAGKTLITASGIAVALVASSSVSSVRAASDVVAFSVRVAVICLITCIFSGFVAILAMMRGFERAQSRQIDAGAGQGQGQLASGELLWILCLAG